MRIIRYLTMLFIKIKKTNYFLCQTMIEERKSILVKLHFSRKFEDIKIYFLISQLHEVIFSTEHLFYIVRVT